MAVRILRVGWTNIQKLHQTVNPSVGFVLLLQCVSAVSSLTHYKSTQDVTFSHQANKKDFHWLVQSSTGGRKSDDSFAMTFIVIRGPYL